MPISRARGACWGFGRVSASSRASANSSTGTRRFMDVSPGRLVEQANERFQLQDYYGAIHLLEEVGASGRAFADAHHLLGLSYSLVGGDGQALGAADRAVAVTPRHVEPLIHRPIVRNELGRGEEAAAAFRRPSEIGGEPRLGFPAH